MSFTYKYARPALTADCVLFGFDGNTLKVLLIERNHAPFEGCWALPGGFAEVGEPLETTAARELREETGLDNIPLEQLHTFSDPKRDPREHVVTVAFLALVELDAHQAEAGSDARRAEWFGLSDLPELAFDHKLIVNTALRRIREKSAWYPLGFGVLPQKFPLSMLQSLYEAILERSLEKDTFRQAMTQAGFVKELEAEGRLYSFDRQSCAERIQQGLRFLL